MINLNNEKTQDKYTLNNSVTYTSIALCLAVSTALPIKTEMEPVTDYIYPLDKSYDNLLVNPTGYFLKKTSPFIDLTNRLDYIKNLENNWNGYNAQSLSNKVIDQAREFLSITIDLSSSLSIFPTASGSLQIEWEKNNYYCEAEIFSNRIEIYAEKDNVDFFEKTYDSLEIATRKFIEIYYS